MSSDPVATQAAMAEAQATTTTSDAIVCMCGMRKTMVKSASAPPITQPPILSTPLLEGRTGAFQRNECAGNERGVDTRPVNRHRKDVTKHRCEGDFEREVHVRRIGERIRDKKAFRFRKMCRRARRIRQKQQVQHDGESGAVSDRDPQPKESSN